MDGEELGSYPVLVGVSPDPASSVTFEHLESVDTTEDTFSDTDELFGEEELSYQPYTIHPLVVPRPRQPVRQDNCPHSTVTRQWRIGDYETCNSCGRKPFLRWFYLCTEDTSGYSASIDQSGSLLSGWITDAILAGEYTSVQKDKLIEQKLRVLEVCEKERNSYISNAQLHTSQARRVGPEASPSFSQSQVHPRPARCQYRACHHCDRKLQERNWLSLNAVCDDPGVKSPSDWDLWETPMSDAGIVRNLGLRYPNPPPPPPHLSQYRYHVSHRLRRIRRSSRQHIAGYESSLSVARMSSLSTIEEVSEEMETEVFTETTHAVGA